MYDSGFNVPCIFARVQLEKKNLAKKQKTKKHSHYRNDHELCELCELCVKADQMLW